MSDIDLRIRQLGNEASLQRQAARRYHDEAQRIREDYQRSLLHDASATFGAVNSIVRNSSVSRAVSVNFCAEQPSVVVWRIDHNPHVKLAEFGFSKNARDVIIVEGTVSKIANHASREWAVGIVSDRVASSFYEKQIAMHPILKWALIVAGAAIAIPFALGALVAVAQIAFGLIMFGICVTVFVGLFEG